MLENIYFDLPESGVNAVDSGNRNGNDVRNDPDKCEFPSLCKQT